MDSGRNLTILFFCLFYLKSCSLFQWPYPHPKELSFQKRAFKKGDTLCFLGDTGTGDRQQAMVASALKEENCKLVSILGDIIYPLGIKSAKDPQLKSKFFLPYKSFWQGAHPVPFQLALGNHDHYGNPFAWREVAQNNPKKVFFPFHYYAQQFGPFCFFTLDTYIYLRWMNIGEQAKQQKWLQEQKQKYKNSCHFSVALGHHPYLSHGEHGDASGSMESFLKNNVVGSFDLYMAGHDHNLAYEGMSEGTDLVVSGAGGKLRGVQKVENKIVQIRPLAGYALLTIINSSGKNAAARLSLVSLKALPNGQVQKDVFYSKIITGQGLR